MITFKAIIIPGNRRKDGTFPVNIRVTFRGKSRRLATTLVCTAADLTRSLKIKNPTILNKSDALIADMRNAVRDISPFDLESHDVDWVVRHIRDRLTENTFRLDFFKWADEFIQSKGESTRKTYITALRSFERYLGKREIDINDITKPLLLDFMDHVESTNRLVRVPATNGVRESNMAKVPKCASSRYILRLAHIFDSARDKYNDEDTGKILIPKSPFSKIDKTAPPSHGQRNLGQEVMQKIISYRTDYLPLRTALDLFVISFGLMGANMADLYAARPVKDGLWIYNRKKTKNRRADHAEMRVEIPEQIRPFLERLQGKGEWWLNRLHEYSTSTEAATSKVNRHFKKWCRENGVEGFAFYAARHTWASLARAQGVDKSTIDDCLAHKGDYSVTDIYAEKAWNLMQEANRKVLALFDWGI